MLKLSYDQINRTNQNSPTIAWYNLTLASSIKNLELVNAAAYAWFTENPTNNITDLEDKLRKGNIDVYLVAKPALELELDGKIVNLQHLNNKTGDKLIYELDFRCQSKLDMEAEFTRENTSYEENYQKLNQSGIYLLSEELTDTDIINSGDVTSMVHKNLAKLKLITLSQEEVNHEMNQDIQRAKEQTGEESSAKPIGQAKDGSVVLAHFVDGKVISQYGLMICHTNDGKQVVKIVLVTDKSTWV